MNARLGNGFDPKVIVSGISPHITMDVHRQTMQNLGIKPVKMIFLIGDRNQPKLGLEFDSWDQAREAVQKIGE